MRGDYALDEGLNTLYPITNFINLLLDAWGGVSAGSSGYHLEPGTLPFGS